MDRAGTKVTENDDSVSAARAEPHWEGTSQPLWRQFSMFLSLLFSSIIDIHLAPF